MSLFNDREIQDFQIETGELPEYPEELYLAFENDCNYRCQSCTVHNFLKGKTKEELEYNYGIIEARIREAMPYAKTVGANGHGELFTSKRTLKLLSEWKPKAPTEECSVSLETNGSLFDKEHWKHNGGQNEMEELFMNIRNPKHPYYHEYKEVMWHPYLSHPKVLEQSGGNDSFIRRAVPYELSDIKWRILTKILDEPDQIMERISKINNPVIYGMGNLTSALVKEMNSRNILPLCIIDGYKECGCFEGIPVYHVKKARDRKRTRLNSSHHTKSRMPSSA